MEKRVDRAALKVNQASIVAGTIIAFLLGVSLGGPWLILLVGLVMVVGTLRRTQGFRPVYLLLRRTGLIKPRVVVDDPAPHLFAQALGATFLLASFVAFMLGATPVGWALAWIVAILAFVNLAVNFCAGCFLYYQLERFGLLPSPTRPKRTS